MACKDEDDEQQPGTYAAPTPTKEAFCAAMAKVKVVDLLNDTAKTVALRVAWHRPAQESGADYPQGL